MNTVTSAKDYLLEFGIKPSIQRLVIMEYLIANRTHPTADEIYSALYKKIPTLSKTTVYNTLRLFTERGVAMMLVIDEKNIRFDIDTTSHAHFLCLGCGCIYDIPVENMEAVHLDGIGELAITETHLYYKGFCKECFGQKGNS